MPYVDEIIDHVAQRIEAVQEFLGQQILIENLSSYVEFNCSEMPEWEFLSRIAERADCLLLLEINNVFVSAYNHNFESQHYLENVPVERVAQHHVAGHREEGALKIDTHDHPVPGSDDRAQSVLSLTSNANEVWCDAGGETKSISATAKSIAISRTPAGTWRS